MAHIAIGGSTWVHIVESDTENPGGEISNIRETIYSTLSKTVKSCITTNETCIVIQDTFIDITQWSALRVYHGMKKV